MTLALFDLTDRKAIVTGAGRGLGRAMAVGLAQFGADVAVVSRTRSELEETAQQVRAAGRACLVRAAHVRNNSDYCGPGSSDGLSSHVPDRVIRIVLAVDEGASVA